MPKLDGFSTTIRIRTDPEFADQSSIAIAALTAHAMNQHKQKCREVGMNDFVAKSFDIQGFKKVLDAFC